MAVFILLHLVALHDSSGLIFYFYLILLGILHRYLNKYFTFYYQLRYLIIIVLFITLLIIFILAGPACMAQLSTIVTKIIFFKNRQIGVNLFSQLYYVKSYLFIYNIKPLISDRQYSSYTRSPAENKSTSGQESRIQPSLNNFYEWFCGLADAESSFYIKVKPKSVEFEFKIALHKDDLPVLLFIKEKLGIGKIDTSLNMASFRVGKLNELLFLLEIFEKFPLNSTKYLNYLDFKKGIELYIKSKSSSTIEIIYNLKSRMNTKRTDFTLPESHQLRITPYWVLGFTEGEGCFSVKKVHPFSLTFSLTQKNNTTLMKALQEFFHNLGVTHNWRNKESAVSVSVDNRIGNKGDITNIYITRVNYITDVLIPFFDSLSWHSKKEQDYKDWKTVLELKKLGLHWLEEGVRVINLILSQINLNRLSTNPARLSPIQLDKLRRDIDKLLSGPSNLEIKADGRIFIKSLNKYYTGSGNIKVNLIGKNGLLNHSFDSISECAKFLGFSAGTVTNRLRDNKPVKVGSKELFVYKGIHNGVIISKRNEIQLGPKFLHNKYLLRSSRQISKDFIAGCPWSKHRLPVIIRKQLHNKAKLAFIFPNYDAAKRIGPHNQDVISVLVGTLLGDCHAEREKRGGVRFRFKQSERHKDYIFWLQEFFYKRGYCSNNLPVLFKDGNKKQYNCYRFVTYRYTSLLWLYKLFYDHNKLKRVPKNIADFLTPLSLAIWISDDGGFHNSGVRIHTNCFTKEER